MDKFWAVAKHEYLIRVRRRTFLIATLGVPLGIAAVMVLSIVVAINSEDLRPLGYVDHSGVLAPAINPSLDNGGISVEIRAYQDVSAAQADLETGKIQAYIILPEDYLHSQQVSVYYWEDRPDNNVWDDFETFLRVNLLADLPKDVRQNILEGPAWTIRSADGRRQISAGIGLLNLVFPFIASFIFFMAVMTSGGYLLQAIADEKENRTIEVMVTSLTPEQLISGKATGLLAVILTQLAVWALAIVIALVIGVRALEPLQAFHMQWDFLLIVALYFLPSFVLIAGIMTAIGGMVTEANQGNQIAGVINLLFMTPWFLSALLFSNPDHPAMVVLTMVPFTAFLTTTMRWSITTIPAWQLVISWLLLIGSASFSLWASARIFRLGMLRYGKRLSLRAALGALRSRRSLVEAGAHPAEVGQDA